MNNNRRRIITYAIYGFVLGSVFPIIATALQMINLQMALSWSNLLAIHRGEELLRIIDTAPIILSASYALIGIQSARYQRASLELDQRIAKDISKTEYESYFLEALIASTSFAVVRLDTNHHIITCNKQFEDLFGYKCDEIVGRHLDDMIASNDLFQEASAVTRSVSGGNLARLISKRMRKDGSLVDVEIIGIPVSVGGEKIGILGLYHDISLRVHAEHALQKSESRFKSLFQDSPISLWEEDFSDVKRLLDTLGTQEEIIHQLRNDDQLLIRCLGSIKILDVNQATVNLYNARSKEDILAGLGTILVNESLDAFREEIIALVRGKYSFDCEITQKKISGELINGWLRLSLPREYRESWSRVYISIQDITERKQAEEKLRFISFHDALTGLYNRAYFEEELVRLNASRQYPISIIVCDLDGLKWINDTEGHAIGDSAIKAAAKILGSGTFRKEDIVARTGGDEFMIILPSIDINQHLGILDRIEKGISVHNASKIEDGLYRPVSLSCGWAVAQQGESLEEAVRQADHAMYKNKSRKKYPSR